MYQLGFADYPILEHNLPIIFRFISLRQAGFAEIFRLAERDTRKRNAGLGSRYAVSKKTFPIC